MSKAVMTGAERKAALLDVGAKLVAKHGAINVTRRMVAKTGKVSDALVSNYFGSTEEARKAYARQAKKLGLEQPSKEKQLTIGTKLRAHAPKDARDARPRSVKEVKAIKKAREIKPTVPKFVPAAKPPKAPTVKPKSAPAPVPASNKSAARAPKAPPSLPALPPLV